VGTAGLAGVRVTGAPGPALSAGRVGAAETAGVLEMVLSAGVAGLAGGRGPAFSAGPADVPEWADSG
jgi:hypothetical protein